MEAGLKKGGVRGGVKPGSGGGREDRWGREVKTGGGGAEEGRGCQGLPTLLPQQGWSRQHLLGAQGDSAGSPQPQTQGERPQRHAAHQQQQTGDEEG